jgi:ABC-2 type transport system permease protein
VVALLVRLKLTLLRNSLRRSVWRTVGLIIGLVYGLGIVAGVLAGLVALRWTSDTLTGDVTVVAFTGLTIGWPLMSLLVFGVDETVDPARFALLPVRTSELLPGLLAAALIGVPGLATVLVGVGLVITWARSLPLTVAALLAMPLGVVSCVLLARVATSALAAVLASRRFRDLAVVGFVLLSIVFALASNVLGRLADTNPEALLAALAAVAQVLGWSPFGWAWAVPADVARGDWLVAGIRLLLAVVLVIGLWRAGRTPSSAGSPRRSSSRATVDRSRSPAGSTGSSRPRRRAASRRGRCATGGGTRANLAGVAGFLVGPIILIVLQLINPMGNGLVAAFAPTLVGLLVGLSLAQDLSFDGSALWLHVGSGLRGADDRAGRAWSALVVFLPMIVVLLAVSLLVSGSWALAAPAAALSLGSALAGLGVGSVVGALWQWPAPPPGANPFASSNQGGLPVPAQRHGDHVRDPAGQPAHPGPGGLVDLRPRGRHPGPAGRVGLGSGPARGRHPLGRPAARAALAGGARGRLGAGRLRYLDASRSRAPETGRRLRVPATRSCPLRPVS